MFVLLECNQFATTNRTYCLNSDMDLISVAFLSNSEFQFPKNSLIDSRNRCKPQIYIYNRWLWTFRPRSQFPSLPKSRFQMRDGLLDVLPLSSLDGLSAEDLRLLLNGCGRVNVTTLISYTSFNDESGKSGGQNAALPSLEFHSVSKAPNDDETDFDLKKIWLLLDKKSVVPLTRYGIVFEHDLACILKLWFLGLERDSDGILSRLFSFWFALCVA